MKTNEQLVKEFQNGNRDSLNQLIIQNEGLCFKLTNRWRNKSYYDDLLQTARISIIRSAEKFNTSLGIKFSGYVYYAIRSSVCSFFRGLRRKNKGTLTFSDVSSLFEDYILDKEDTRKYLSYDDIEIHEILHEKIKLLTEKQQEAVNLLLTGYNLTEIAEHFVVTRQAISARFIALQHKLKLTMPRILQEEYV